VPSADALDEIKRAFAACGAAVQVDLARWARLSAGADPA
jgi:hypothetical protein